MLEIDNVSFAYGAENVLEKINFKLESGDFWAVIGPNGGGKTTFVKILLGLLKPNKGEISYTSNIQPCHIGNVPQMTYHNIQFPICVRDTIALGLLQPRIFGFNPKKSQDSIFQAMELLEITHLAKKPLYALSGGERQKVLIARAIVNNPQILILDEPTANIDSKAQKSIYELLKKLNRTMSIIVVSHDLSLTLGYAKKVLYVNKNAVIHEIPDFKLDVSGHICEVDLLTHFAMQPNNSSFEREHSVLSDKSRITSAEAVALTPSKLLASASQNHDLLKKPAATSPCTASLVFSSQSLECRDSSYSSLGNHSDDSQADLCSSSLQAKSPKEITQNLKDSKL